MLIKLNTFFRQHRSEGMRVNSASRLTPPPKAPPQPEGGRWWTFGWLFGACYGGGAAVLSGIQTKLKEHSSSTQAPAYSIDDIIKANNNLIIKFNRERQQFIDGAEILEQKAKEQIGRSKDPKLSATQRDAAKENALTFAKRKRTAELHATSLRLKIEKLETANQTHENNRDNADYVSLILANAAVLKQQKGLTADLAGEAMDELNDAIEEANNVTREVSRAISGDTSSPMLDDDDALAMLEGWLQEDESSKETEALRKAPPVPNSTIPSTQPTPQPQRGTADHSSHPFGTTQSSPHPLRTTQSRQTASALLE